MKNHEVRRKLLDVADFVRNSYFPFTEGREVNDAKAIGVALSKCLQLDNIACLAYHAMNESKDPLGKEKAAILSGIWEGKYDTIISNGHRAVTNQKGMTCSVYTTDYGGVDCTLGGVTSRRKRVLLVGDGVPEIFEAGDDDEVLVLQKKEISGKTYLFAKPLDSEDSWTMFGGNFIYSSDSRFPNKYPIPVHDRVEGTEEELLA